MITYGSNVTIARPPEQVWPYVTEPEKQAQWTDVGMKPVTQGPWRVGTRIDVTFGRPPLRASIGLELTAVEPGQRMAFMTYKPGPILWDGEYRLEAVAGGTRLSQAGKLRFRGLWRLLEPIVGSEIRRNEIAELERLKKVLEGA
jgi:uncharacterized protein YndB with AHSA1/START domain